jgi:hypothetical protein
MCAGCRRKVKRSGDVGGAGERCRMGRMCRMGQEIQEKVAGEMQEIQDAGDGGKKVRSRYRRKVRRRCRRLLRKVQEEDQKECRCPGVQVCLCAGVLAC